MHAMRRCLWTRRPSAKRPKGISTSLAAGKGAGSLGRHRRAVRAQGISGTSGSRPEGIQPEQSRAFLLREAFGMEADKICKSLGVSSSNLLGLLIRGHGAPRLLAKGMV